MFFNKYELNIKLRRKPSLVKFETKKWKEVVTMKNDHEVLYNFTDRVAIITGSSRGLGKNIALAFSPRGAKVIVNYVKNRNLAQKVVASIISSGGVAMALKADVTDLNEVNDVIQKTIEKFGRIDVLVNCAGVHDDARVINMSQASWNRVIMVNLSGTFNCMKAVIPVMMKQRYGRIINISSIVGLRSVIGTANYAASKIGVIALTKTVAKEIAKYGITANVVAPGYINTGMGGRLHVKLKKKILPQIPVGRFGSSSEVTEVVSFLASDSASYITGQVIIVDGGFTL